MVRVFQKALRRSAFLCFVSLWEQRNEVGASGVKPPLSPSASQRAVPPRRYSGGIPHRYSGINLRI
ncbi:MAG: hypothetical protein FWE60_02420 [Oscillospiraceae bacterium]|nr:hypothetical protein [Oscillospiraceae bacterium]